MYTQSLEMLHPRSPPGACMSCLVFPAPTCTLDGDVCVRVRVHAGVHAQSHPDLLWYLLRLQGCLLIGSGPRSGLVSLPGLRGMGFAHVSREGALRRALGVRSPHGGLPEWFSAKASACQCRKCGLDPWIGTIPWTRHGNPLQDSCLENPMDGGAWRATVRGVAESDTTEAT